VGGVPPPKAIWNQSVFSRQSDRLAARTAGEVSAKSVSPAPPSDHRFQEPVPAGRVERIAPPQDSSSEQPSSVSGDIVLEIQHFLDEQPGLGEFCPAWHHFRG